MIAQHTPGPYAIHPAFNRRHVLIISEVTREPLAQVYHQANAPLFAAAPLLLAQLTFAAARIELANSEGDAILSAWLPDARAAITSAKREVHAGVNLPDVRLIAKETLVALKQAAAALAICANYAPEEQRATIISWFNAARAQIKKAEVVAA
ncbi:hypothetical protein [Rhodoblastus acidophilus]|nr:hypothetical protein [Rhodoblastus acidophilus]PPQ35153.1 hypothetical protein CKO16_20990 [Rhodoblastus acidophilus]RAI16898.1 hypothetical protein CH337_18910 [Rhodoblastus acidophilus]